MSRMNTGVLATPTRMGRLVLVGWGRPIYEFAHVAVRVVVLALVHKLAIATFPAKRPDQATLAGIILVLDEPSDCRSISS